jgi:glycosyltransferase involved in cell wall biosynthesis
MKESRPLVSVIIPVYNGEAFLAEAVESIQRQDYHPLEIIIVDDGSTDGTATVASRFKEHVRYIYQSNSWPAAARNRGLRMANGEVIGFLDADDLWTEKKLELQLGRMAKDQSVDIIIGLQLFVKVDGVVDGKHTFEKLLDPLVNLNLGSALFRRAVFDRVGFFDETLYYCDDWDWFMRARELGVPMVIHQDVTLVQRRHESNMTNNTVLGNRYMMQMLKKSLDRRRRKDDSPGTSLPGLSDFEEKPAR